MFKRILAVDIPGWGPLWLIGAMGLIIAVTSAGAALYTSDPLGLYFGVACSSLLFVTFTSCYCMILVDDVCLWRSRPRFWAFLGVRITTLVLFIAAPVTAVNVAHRAWWGPGHWLLSEHYGAMHPETGIVVARGTTDAKELGRPAYLIVDWDNQHYGREFYEMSEAELTYPPVGARVSVVNPWMSAWAVARPPAKAFRVVN